MSQERQEVQQQQEDQVQIQGEPSFQPYNDQSQHTAPISASPARSIVQSPESMRQPGINQSQDIQIYQLQEQIRQQEQQHQNAINMYLQIIRFYDQNLLNLKNLIISKEQELKAKTTKVNQLQSLIEQIQASFQAICYKYETENAELMQRYMQTMDEFNKKTKQPEHNQSPEAFLEVVQLREKLVESNQKRSQLEMSMRETQLRYNQDQKMIQDLRQENMLLHQKVNYLTSQINQYAQMNNNQMNNQKSVSPPHLTTAPNPGYSGSNQKMNEPLERTTVRKLNKSDIHLQPTHDHVESNLLQSYSIGSRVQQQQPKSDSKDQLSSKLMNLNSRRTQLENELNKFPLHVRNLSEKRRRQQLEDSLNNIEEEITNTRQELSHMR